MTLEEFYEEQSHLVRHEMKCDNCKKWLKRKIIFDGFIYADDLGDLIIKNKIAQNNTDVMLGKFISDGCKFEIANDICGSICQMNGDVSTK